MPRQHPHPTEPNELNPHPNSRVKGRAGAGRQRHTPPAFVRSRRYALAPPRPPSRASTPTTCVAPHPCAGPSAPAPRLSGEAYPQHRRAPPEADVEAGARRSRLGSRVTWRPRSPRF
eukprot:scaffold16716_cov134-Isochrysis_galbana.AAC.5